MKRLVYYLDVGHLPKEKSDVFVEEMIKSFRDMLDSDPETKNMKFFTIVQRTGHGHRLETIEF